MILTGDLYPVAELEPLGLFDAVMPAEGLRAAVQRMLDRVTAWTPTVVASQKRLFEVWQNSTLADGIDTSVEIFAGVFESHETTAQIEARRAQVGRRREDRA